MTDQNHREVGDIVKNFYIDQESNDILIDGNGNFKVISGKDEIAQQINRTLTTRQGEWFLNTDFGLNWNIVFAKPYNEQQVKGEIQRAILAVDGVAEVTQLRLNFNSLTRRLNADFIAITEQNDTIEGVSAVG